MDTEKKFWAWLVIISASFIVLLTTFLMVVIFPFHIEQMKARSRETVHHLQNVLPHLDPVVQQQYLEQMLKVTNDLSYLLLMDRQGNALVHSDPARIGMNFDETGLRHCLTTGETIEQIYIRDADKPLSPYHGEKTIDILAPYYSLQGRIEGAVNVGLSLAAIDRAKNHYIFVSAAGTILWIVFISGFAVSHVRTMRLKRMTDKALVESEAKYRFLVENTLDIAFKIDCEGNITFIGPQIGRYGYQVEELLGRSFVQFIHPQDVDPIQETLLKFVQSEASSGASFRIMDKTGNIVWFETSGSAFREEDGRLSGVSGTLRDVTKRLLAEQELRESQKRFADIVEFLPDATFIINHEKKIIAWNLAMEEMTGVSKNDVIGEDHACSTVPFYGYKRQYIMDLIFQEDPELTAKYSYVQKKGDTYFAEVFAPALHDGKGAFIWIAASPMYDSDKSVIGAIESIRDITEQRRADEALKKSEANYRNVIENIQDIFYRSDAQGNLIMASPSILTLLGYDSLDDCLSRPLAATFYFDPEKRTKLLSEIQAKGSVTNYEVILKRRDGTPVAVETNSHIYFDDDGRVAGVEGTFRDITERKQAEDDRKKLESQLIQAQKMEAIGTLAGGIAHDFNNILGAIMGYTELYKEQVRDRPKVYHSMEEVFKAANRAKDLVQQILTFSRQTTQEKRPTMIVPIINEVASFIRASLPTTIEIKQRLNVTSDVIMADATQMHQVLMNLCTNASHAMMENGGVLEIGLEEVFVGKEEHWRFPSLAGGRYLKLDVKDTGHGITAGNMDKIFQPYFTTKEKGKGTGLGLAVVHGIVKEQGGEIKAYSEVGKGALFSVYLPLMEKLADTILPAVETALPGGSERILFIDDEDTLANLGKEMLEELGYQVVVETDPVKAIEEFKKDKETFDLVITDKTMPHMTGFDVARELREIRADIPVILCSGFQGKEDMEKQSAIGISCFIIKPIGMHILAETIRNVLDKR